MANRIIDAIPDPFTRGWYTYQWNMTHRHKYGWFEGRIGPPGSGKTYSVTTDCCILYPDFDPAVDICFTPLEFLDRLDFIDTGDAVVFEEVGVALSSRRWFTGINIAMTQVMQTMRHKKFIVKMTVPDLSFIDTQARKVLHCYSECSRSADDPTIVKVFKIDVNGRSGKIYYKYPRILKDATMYSLRDIVMVTMPPKWIIDKYEKRARDYKLSVEKKARQYLRKLEDMGVEIDAKDLALDVADDPDSYKNKSGRLDTDVIKEELDISRRKAATVKKFAEIELAKREKKRSVIGRSIRDNK